MAKQIGGLE